MLLQRTGLHSSPKQHSWVPYKKQRLKHILNMPNFRLKGTRGRSSRPTALPMKSGMWELGTTVTRIHRKKMLGRRHKTLDCKKQPGHAGKRSDSMNCCGHKCLMPTVSEVSPETIPTKVQSQALNQQCQNSEQPCCPHTDIIKLSIICCSYVILFTSLLDLQLFQPDASIPDWISTMKYSSSCLHGTVI